MNKEENKKDFIKFLVNHKDMYLIAYGLIDPTPEQDEYYDIYFLKELDIEKKKFEELILGKSIKFNFTPHADFLEQLTIKKILKEYNNSKM